MCRPSGQGVLKDTNNFSPPCGYIYLNVTKINSVELYLLTRGWIRPKWPGGNKVFSGSIWFKYSIECKSKLGDQTWRACRPTESAAHA